MAEKGRSAGRRIEMSVKIRASLEEVWRALSTAEGLTNWFPVFASVKPGPDGSMSLGWDEAEMWEAPISTWEPNARLGVASEMPSKDGGTVRLVVDYYLEAHGDTVTVRLVHSGFDDSDTWDDYIDGTTAGWTYFLFNLRHALERHPGIPRVMVSARPRMRAGIDEAQRLVFGQQGLELMPEVTSLREGSEASLLLDGERLRARTAVAVLPRAVAFVLPDLNDALLMVEREGLKEKHRTGIWLSLYGVDAERTERLRRAIDSLGSRLEAAAPSA